VLLDHPSQWTRAEFLVIALLGKPCIGFRRELNGDVAVAPVPEPSTWAMMILGFAGVGFIAYRRRKTTVLGAA